MKHHWNLFWGVFSRARWGRGTAARSERSTSGGRGTSGGRDASRRGIALIVVLGFLSIMLMMAVAFLTHSRMERMVAGTSLEAQRGRQLVRTAFSAAMNDYSRHLLGLVMPVHPDDEFFLSEPPSGFGISGTGGTIGGSGIELLAGEALDWVPRKYTNAPYNAITDVNNARWILVRENPTSSGGQNRILGRYAYAIFDMSGGIDANLIARDVSVAGNDARVASNRVRRSARQVPMGLLPEVLNYSKFKSLRRGWKGFDSLQMLIKLTDGRYIDGQTDFESGDMPAYGRYPSAIRWSDPDRIENYPALASNLVSDLTPYSLSAFRGARYDQGSGSWTPYTLIDDTTVWTTTLDLISSQFAPGWQAWIDDALYDYTHNDPVPRGTDYPSPKNVPMFNEVAGTLNLVEQADPLNPGYSDYFLEIELDFEFWYPFPSVDNNTGHTFELPSPTVGGSYSKLGTGENIWIRIVLTPPATDNLNFQLGPLAPLPPVPVTARYSNGQPYLPGASPTFSYRLPIIRSGNTNLIEAGARLMIQGVEVQEPIYLTRGTGINADMLPVGLPLSGAITLQDAAPEPATFARAVTDPRLNHLPGEWVDENNGNGSLNDMNDAMKPGGADYDAYIREGTNMYCRNGPMETPAELGFISNGRKWETIDLCTPAAVEVLAPLVADTNLFFSGTGGGNVWNTDSVFYTNGTINPNTRSSNVLASVFYDLATQEVPNTETTVAGANPIDEETAQLIASQILQLTKAGKIGTAFQAGSDWVQIPAMQQNGTLWSGHGLNNNQREALLRNTWGVFNPDNSLFTVVVVAQAIKEGPSNVGIWDENEDMVTGERRAVALVWRDPFKTGQNLHHEMFIRMVRHLSD